MSLFAITGVSPFYLADRFRVTQYQDFARDMFSGVVPVENVLSSVVEIGTGFGQATCSAAIVRLSDDAPLAPPAMRPVDRTDDRVGGFWLPTPQAEPLPGDADALTVCVHAMDGGVLRELRAAINHEGAFVIRDRLNRILQIYAPKARLAAFLRYTESAP